MSSVFSIPRRTILLTDLLLNEEGITRDVTDIWNKLAIKTILDINKAGAALNGSLEVVGFKDKDVYSKLERIVSNAFLHSIHYPKLENHGPHNLRLLNISIIKEHYAKTLLLNAIHNKPDLKSRKNAPYQNLEQENHLQKCLDQINENKTERISISDLLRPNDNGEKLNYIYKLALSHFLGNSQALISMYQFYYQEKKIETAYIIASLILEGSKSSEEEKETFCLELIQHLAATLKNKGSYKKLQSLASRNHKIAQIYLLKSLKEKGNKNKARELENKLIHDELSIRAATLLQQCQLGLL